MTSGCRKTLSLVGSLRIYTVSWFRKLALVWAVCPLYSWLPSPGTWNYSPTKSGAATSWSGLAGLSWTTVAQLAFVVKITCLHIRQGTTGMRLLSVFISTQEKMFSEAVQYCLNEYRTYLFICRRNQILGRVLVSLEICLFEIRFFKLSPMSGHMFHCDYEGHWTVLWNYFCLCTFTWDPGNQQRLSVPESYFLLWITF